MIEDVEKILNFASQFNVQTLVGMWVIVWYFTRDLKNSINALDKDLREMNSRTSRLEGTVYGHKVYYHIKNKTK